MLQYTDKMNTNQQQSNSPFRMIYKQRPQSRHVMETKQIVPKAQYDRKAISSAKGSRRWLQDNNLPNVRRRQQFND